MPTITVLHNISPDAGFGLNTTFTSEGKTSEPRSHELVRVFEFQSASITRPDDIFRCFNISHERGMADTLLEHDLALGYRARRLRSLSIGDVLVFDGVTFLACESAGWKVVSHDDLRILTAEEAGAAIRARYGFGPGEKLSITVPLEG